VKKEERMTTSAGVSIPDLRNEFDGRVIGPHDEAYDEARRVFSGNIDRRPALIIRPADAKEASRVVALARDSGLELAVRGGGHSAAGHGTSHGGIVLDLAEMRALEIDPERRTAWAETGLTAGEVTNATAEHGLAIGFGDTGSVGIGGLTLGGGVGFLVRRFGLTVDNLVAAEIVTADGEVVYVDAETHPDLFWAIRGGGGNFGVATRFQYRLRPLESVVGGILILPATPDVIAGFLTEAERAPNELSTIANVMPAPPMPFLAEEHHGTLVVFAFLTYAGETEAGERAVAPFRSLAKPLADMVRPMRYPEMYMPDDPDYHPVAVGRTMFVDAVEARSIETIVERLESGTAPMRVTQIRALGGAMSDVPNDATAFAHRDRSFMVNVAAVYERPDETPTHEAWVTTLASELQHGDLGAYVGFLGDEGEERVRQAYPGPTWDRLAEIKTRYDPGNLFRLNQNVPPRGPLRSAP
jgi:FAD/FMN-containing dehydrogenase